MITYVDVQNLSNEFACLPQERIDPFIARAARRLNSDFWGDLYDDGLLYLTAHLLAQVDGSGSGGAAGAVISKTVGPLSVTYANVSASTQAGAIPTEYARTVYGQNFWALLQTLRFKASPKAI